MCSLSSDWSERDDNDLEVRKSASAYRFSMACSKSLAASPKSSCIADGPIQRICFRFCVEGVKAHFGAGNTYKKLFDVPHVLAVIESQVSAVLFVL